jgi:hypothetical protein
VNRLTPIKRQMYGWVEFSCYCGRGCSTPPDGEEWRCHCRDSRSHVTGSAGDPKLLSILRA